MAGPYVYDRVKETTTTTGTGTITLAGAAAGFRSFSVVGDGNSCPYCIEDGTDWEVGEGTYTVSGTTLSRTTILASSNAGAAVNWGAGTKNVFIPGDASRSPANADYFWDRASKFLGIGTASPTAKLHVASGNIRVSAVSAPATAMTAALAGAGAGNVDNGTHAYKVSYVTPIGETTLGTLAVTVAVADKTTNGQVSLSSVPVGDTVVTARKIYRSKAGGGPYYLLATIADNTTTTYTDNTADSSLVTLDPGNNTTGGQVSGSTTAGTGIQLAPAGNVQSPIFDKNGAVRNIKAYGATSSANRRTNGAMTAASATLTSSGFVSTDVGKVCAVAWAGSGQVANPTTQATVSVTGGGATGGNLAAGNYYVAYTWTTAYGETTAGTSESAQFTVATGNIPRVTIPSLPGGAIAANIYLTAVGGASASEKMYAAGVTTTTYDLASLSRSDLDALPTVNRTAGPLIGVITGFTSTTVVTLDTAATVTVSSADVLYGVDSTAAIQAAIDADTGGIVFIPTGNYIVSQLRLKLNTWLVGTGQGANLYHRGGSTGHMIVLDSSAALHCGVLSMTLNGAKSVQTTAVDIINFANGTTGDKKHVMRDLWLEQARNNGITAGADTRGTSISECYIYEPDNYGIEINSTDVECFNVTVSHAGKHGIVVGSGAGAVRFVGSRAYYCGRLSKANGAGAYIDGTGIMLTGCHFDDNASHGTHFQTCARMHMHGTTYAGNGGDALRLEDVTDSKFDGFVGGGSGSNQLATSIVNLTGTCARCIVRLGFDNDQITPGAAPVQGTVNNCDVQVGQPGGVGTLTYSVATVSTADVSNVLTTAAAHRLNVDDPVYLETTGTFPAATPTLSATVVYYVKTVPSSTTLTLATSAGGTEVDITNATFTPTFTIVTLKPDPYLTAFQTCALTKDSTLANSEFHHVGQRISFQFAQDATGGRKLTLGNKYTIQEFLPRTSASKVNSVDFIYNGSTWIQTGGQFSASQNSRLATDAPITTTQSDVTDTLGNLLQFAIGDSEVWSFEYNLQTGSSSAAGIQFALTVPAGATFRAVMVGMTTAVTAQTCSIMTVSGTLAIAVNTANLATGWVRIAGTIANAAADGFVTLQADKVTSGTGTVFANSYLNARRIS